MAALLTRISTCPMAASAAGTRFSTSSGSARLQRTTCTRPLSLPASESSISIRVPEIVTVAPFAWSARAIAPPMPPVAPVTSAVLPGSANIRRPSRRPRCTKRTDIFPSPDRRRRRPGGNALHETAQHFAGADLVESGHTLLRHEGDALAPPHHAGDLLDQTLPDLGRIGNG